MPQVTSGTGPRSGESGILFTFAANPGNAGRSATVRIGTASFAVTQFPAPRPLAFVPIVPCRLMDTRAGNVFGGAFGPPRLAGGVAREIPILSGACGIPATARAYSLNFTVVPAGVLSFLSTWPAGQPQPLVSTSNARDGRVVANTAIVPADANGSINVFASDATELVIDINGYFVPRESAAEGLSFYTVTPCRAVDTRDPASALIPVGAPRLSAGVARTLPIAGHCGVPPSARAVWANVTAIPRFRLPFLALWPAGQPQPPVFTLNSFPQATGPVANAAILPLGTNGAVNAFGAGDTDVVLDIYGYFGPAGGANALNFYAVSPCRVADSRPTGFNFFAGNDRHTYDLAASPCNIPHAAEAVSAHLTVVPIEWLGFLSQGRWPQTSLLNSSIGQIVSNAALLISPDGRAELFATQATHVIFDVNGYFAP